MEKKASAQKLDGAADYDAELLVRGRGAGGIISH